MIDKKAMEQGWKFASQTTAANVATVGNAQYANRVTQVGNAIDELYNNLMSLKSNQSDSVLGGFAAEEWHAGTFNVNAKAAGSSNVAYAGKPGTNGELGRNNYGSVDVRVQSADGTVINDYGSKYMVNAKETAKQQAQPNHDGPGTKYGTQKRLVASDQLKDVKDISEYRAENLNTPENWKQGYKETSELATDRITDGKVESKPLSKKDSERLAKDVKDDNLDLKKYGVENELTKPAAIMKQAVKAGLNAAMISAIMQTAPDIFKSISYLIKNKEIDLNQLKTIGSKAITAGAEGFIIGSVACTLQLRIAEGAFGAALQQAIAGSLGPMVIGTVVSLAYTTIKNSVLVASGKMSAREMGAALIDTVAMSSSFVAGAYIGGIIGQAIGFAVPVVGYLLGSLISSAFSVVYNIGKNKFLSFCVDSGFTCFGLVDQDYTLPEELLKDMGIDITPITRTQISRTEISRTTVGSNINRTTLDTIDLKIVKRGIIGVNKVGYVL